MATSRTLPSIDATRESAGNVGRTGETLVVDKNTFEIKGADSGTVYGTGSSLSEALALQTQMQSGGTPTVAGRPDLFAVTPTDAEVEAGIQDIAGADGTAVTPRTATAEELAARSAGTLESFASATGGLSESDKAKKFSDAVSDAVRTSVADSLESKLSSESPSLDTKLLLQKGALTTALLGENLTPEDLRWLSPQQQKAIRDGDEAALKSHYAGLLSVINGRKEQAEEAEAKAQRQIDDAFARLSTLQSFGMLSGISEDEISDLASTIGIDVSEIEDLVAAENAGAPWDLRNDPNGNLIAYRFDESTGTFESKVLMSKAGRSGGGSGSGTTTTSTGGTGTTSVMSEDEFTQAYIQQKGELQGQSPDITNPSVKAELDALYSEYLNSVQTSAASNLSTAAQEVLDDPSFYNDLTATNKTKVRLELREAGYDTSFLSSSSSDTEEETTTTSSSSNNYFRSLSSDE